MQWHKPIVLNFSYGAKCYPADFGCTKSVMTLLHGFTMSMQVKVSSIDVIPAEKISGPKLIEACFYSFRLNYCLYGGVSW